MTETEFKIPDHIAAAAAVQVARETLSQYTNREGLKAGDIYGTWDLTMAARLASDVEHLLNVIEKMQA